MLPSRAWQTPTLTRLPATRPAGQVAFAGSQLRCSKSLLTPRAGEGDTRTSAKRPLRSLPAEGAGALPYSKLPLYDSDA